MSSSVLIPLMADGMVMERLRLDPIPLSPPPVPPMFGVLTGVELA